MLFKQIYSVRMADGRLAITHMISPPGLQPWLSQIVVAGGFEVSCWNGAYGEFGDRCRDTTVRYFSKPRGDRWDEIQQYVIDEVESGEKKVEFIEVKTQARVYACGICYEFERPEREAGSDEPTV